MSTERLDPGIPIGAHEAPTIFSASRTRISPDMSFGRSRSRVAARVRDSARFARTRFKSGATSSSYVDIAR